MINLTKKYLFVFLLFCLLGIYTMSSHAKVYNYIIQAGSPNNYPMSYDFEGNYFFNEKGQAFFNFTTPGGGSAVTWGNGTQATLLSEYHPLPYGINVRWFSFTENQFWEGRYVFNQQVLQKLPNYVVNNLLFKSKIPFTRYFAFKVYVTPSGLVTIWVSSEGEQFLLAQFYAKKMTPEQEPDWKVFYRRALNPIGKVIKPRATYVDYLIKESEDYVKNSLKGKPEKFNTVQTKKPYTAEPWLRTMKSYHWSLKLNNDFTLKDYLAWFVNGEKIFTYVGDNQLTVKRAAPYDFTIYFTDKNNTLERVDLTLDAEEVMQAFQKIELTPPVGQAITLSVEMAKDYSKLNAYLIKDKTKIELKKIIKADLTDLYNVN